MAGKLLGSRAADPTYSHFGKIPLERDLDSIFLSIVKYFRISEGGEHG